MSLIQFFNSDPVKQFRTQILSDQPTDICNRCHQEEQFGHVSRRQRANQKSVIFTKTAFENSFQQSPGYRHFKYSHDNQGATQTLPIDLHVDLGNYCNMACKFCYTGASSKIVSQYVKWGHSDYKKFQNNDWTRNSETWQKFLNELLEIPKLKNIHFMGGETLLTSKLEELVDFMIAHERFDLCFSFVTNGSIYKKELMDKLKKFSRVGIEISIETLTAHNSYIRQGTDTDMVLQNIEQFVEDCNNSSITLTIRPTVTALSLGYYYTLIEYCLAKKFLIQGLIVSEHQYLDPNIIPYNIKQHYLKNYQDLLDKLDDVDVLVDFNANDPNNYIQSIKNQLLTVINILNTNVEVDNNVLKQMVEYCKKWDSVYNLNAVELYPELAEIFIKYDY